MPNQVTSVLGGGGESGSGYRIGDNHVLTAGHVVYDWLNIGHFPADIDDGGLTVALDYRGYRNAFVQLVNGWSGPGVWPVQMSDGTTITNDIIATHPNLLMRDSVLIANTGGAVGSADEGLVVFLDRQDLPRTDATHHPNHFGSTTGVIRRDQGSPDPGVIQNIDPNGGGISATQPNPPWAVAGGVPLPGTFRFSVNSVHGDSGGAYLLQYEGSEFVLGTHFANIGSDGLGTYFSYGEWTELNIAIQA